MNYRRNILVALLLAVSAGTWAQNLAEDFIVGEPLKLRTPILNDSVNTAGKGFSPDFLLKTPLPAGWKHRAGEKMAADTAGFISMEKAGGEDNLLYIIRTKLKGDRFVKGKLQITSPARWQLFVDGRPVQGKETAEDSLQAAAAKDYVLNLEPERCYDVCLNVLSAVGDKCAPALKVEYLRDKGFEDFNVVVDAAMKNRFLLPNTAFGNRVTNASLSPDGSYLLTTVLYQYSKDRYEYVCQLSETASGRVLSATIPTHAQWMPKSNKLYYTVKGDVGLDLRTLDPKTMATETVVAGIPEDAFEWSPDERRLFFYTPEKGVAEVGPLKRVLTPDDRIPGNRDRVFISVFDIASGVLSRLTYGNHSTYLNDVTADGRKLLYSTTRENPIKRPFNMTSFFQVDLETMVVDTIVRDDPFVTAGVYSPDGSQILFSGSPEAFGKVGMNCGKHKIPNYFDTQAFILNVEDGKVNPITKDFAPSVSAMRWSKADGCIYLGTDDRDCKNVYRYSPVTGDFEKLPLQLDCVQKFSLSESGTQLVAYVGQGDYVNGAAYLYDVERRTSRLIADPMKPVFDDIEFGKIDTWTFKASDGTVIDGRICLPPDFDASKKYPLIVYYYGGTTPTARGLGNAYVPQIFASRGYVVYVVQPSGTIGYGQEFSARHVNAWGKRTADDIIEGTKKFCKEHPFVDAERIGCLGASYGGFMTQYLQTRTDIFAAAISHAGISNVTSYWGEGYWGYSYNGIAAADSYPWTDPELFTKQGSLFNADKINTPLLLLHGTVDTNVPTGESIQLFNALKILGKPVELILIEGEDHFVLDYDKRVLWQNTIMAWFARWLQDSPEWWNEMYPEKYYE